MSTNLITLPEGPPVPLPPARNKGAEELYAPGRMDRLYHWLPPEAKPLAAQFITAVAAEVNGLPKDTDPRSVVRSVFNLATLGLVPGQQRGHAHLLTFLLNRGKPSQVRMCQLVIGYRGFTDLAWGTGFLAELLCEVVLNGEEFSRWNDGRGADYHHNIPLGRQLKWGNVAASYCYYKPKTTPKDGKGNIVIVESEELGKLKRKQGNVWDSNPIPMAQKTGLIRASKLWKITGKMANAVWLSEADDRGEAQPVLPEAAEAIGQIEGNTPPPKLAEFDVPNEPAKPAADAIKLTPEQLAARTGNYGRRIVKAGSGSALESVWSDVDSDGELLEEDKQELQKQYEAKRRELS